MPKPINLRDLLPQFYTLTKSSVQKGLQCKKYLHLLRYKPASRTPHDAATLQKFSDGRSFEGLFKATFPEGVDVQQLLQKDVWSIGASYTAAALASGEPQTLFEACFIANKTLVMTDVCQVLADGSIDIYEVKNATEIKEVFIWDLAIQYYVIQQLYAERLRHFYLVLNNGQDGFVLHEMSAGLAEYLPQLQQQIPELLQVLSSGRSPVICMGPQCRAPYPCEYIAYCSGHAAPKAKKLFSQD